MSDKSNLAVVQEFLQRFGESNYVLLYELQSQVDWKIFPGPAEAVVPWFGHFRGRDAAEECMDAFTRTIQILEFSVKDYLSGPYKVGAIIDARYRCKDTEKAFSMNFVNVMEVRNNRIVSIHEYGDTADAVQAFSPHKKLDVT
jgi:ketosteroid isomerase-like protein